MCIEKYQGLTLVIEELLVAADKEAVKILAFLISDCRTETHTRRGDTHR
jgi:hypothetical protein